MAPPMRNDKVVIVLAQVAMLLVVKTQAHGQRNGWVKPPTPKGVIAMNFVYEVDGASYTGYAAYPSSAASTLPLPGVLVAHQWYGLGGMEKYRAEEMVTNMGYIAFALDVYGTGKRASNDAEAKILMDTLLAEPAELRKRINAGLAQLRGFDEGGARVNQLALFANGYCFGGLMVLEAARTGNELLALNSFHGELGNLSSQAEDNFKVQSIQAHHAELDFAGDGALRAFEAEMKSHNVPHWSTLYYGHVEHGWTDPSAASYSPLEADSAHAAMFAQYRLLQPLQPCAGLCARIWAGSPACSDLDDSFLVPMTGRCEFPLGWPNPESGTFSARVLAVAREGRCTANATIFRFNEDDADAACTRTHRTGIAADLSLDECTIYRGESLGLGAAKLVPCTST